MNIVYSSSDYYSECTGISLYSLYQNNANNDVSVYIIGSDIKEKNCGRLRAIAQQFGRELTIIEAEKGFQEAAQKFHFESLRGAYNTFARIMLNQWLGTLDKVLVIDSDSLICDDLAELWALDMGNNLYAAVPEVSMYGKHNYIEDPSIVNAHPIYFNAGICMVNLKAWREQKIDALLADRLSGTEESFLNSEQSIMNKYFGDRMMRMPLRYNYYTTVHYLNYEAITKLFYKKKVFSSEEYADAKMSPAIIHYCGFSYERPWFRHSVAYRKQDYLQVRSLTPWRDEPLKKWSRRGSTVMDCYDMVCFCLLKLGGYRACLYFRLDFGQRIKGMLLNIKSANEK